jgi:hypothetical protein
MRDARQDVYADYVEEDAPDAQHPPDGELYAHPRGRS